MSDDAIKLELINRIMSLKDAHKLRKIEATLKDMWSDDEIIKKHSKKMNKKINIEEAKKKQNFEPINKEDFLKKIDLLNIEEPLEDLLRML